jgi:hypothetical protein
MRRLDGVSFVQLDTVDQLACVYIGSPTQIDFSEFISAAEDAAYTTVGLRLFAEGRVDRTECDDCGQEREFLNLESGQRFELGENDFEPGQQVSLEARVIGWASEHPTLIPTM